jgi:Na+/H+-translocating membrane pyrophosphatase
MGMETGILVGIMSVAFIFSLIFSWVCFRYLYETLWLALTLTLVLVFFLQAALQTALQARSCGGVKRVDNIFWGALIGTVPAMIMVTIPAYLESAAKLVSGLFVIPDTDEGVAITRALGTAYFGGFAGAMGIALGSLQSASCY